MKAFLRAFLFKIFRQCLTVMVILSIYHQAFAKLSTDLETPSLRSQIAGMPYSQVMTALKDSSAFPIDAKTKQALDAKYAQMKGLNPSFGQVVKEVPQQQASAIALCILAPLAVAAVVATFHNIENSRLETLGSRNRDYFNEVRCNNGIKKLSENIHSQYAEFAEASIAQ